VSIRRSPDDAKWLLYFKGESEPKAFDKVVFAHGSEHVRKYPAIENQDAFEGIFIHGQEYKRYVLFRAPGRLMLTAIRPGAFKDMNVIVMGQGNSAGDCVNVSLSIARFLFSFLSPL
jgi:dimethylaniline monooxygenase (N-oxide forming)